MGVELPMGMTFAVGRLTVPYLVDPEREVSMHESGDIIDYLQRHYAK